MSTIKPNFDAYLVDKLIVQAEMANIKPIICISKCEFLDSSLLKLFYHLPKGLFNRKPNHDYILALGDFNCIYACLSSKKPKEIFQTFYQKK